MRIGVPFYQWKKFYVLSAHYLLHPILMILTTLTLQIFTNTMVGPIFYEIIQRKGDEGFGEGNFQALFDSIELDQVRRGYLKEGS